MRDVLDLLRQDKIEKHAMRLDNRVEIRLADMNSAFMPASRAGVDRSIT